MQIKHLKQIFFILLLGISCSTVFSRHINAQNSESRHEQDKEKKKDDRKKKDENKPDEKKLMQEWFSSPENRKKILEEKARNTQREDESKKERLKNAKRREKRKAARRNRDFEDDTEESAARTESDFSYNPKDHYDTLYAEIQAAAVDRETYLQQQNRLSLSEHQKEYLQHLQTDNSILKNWKNSAKNQSKNYRYVSRGTVRYTTQAGAEMIRRAVNTGYERGVLIGQTDLKDKWGYDPENSYVYQDAIHGYDNFLIDLTEYRFYFQQGFWRGYEDGFNKRFIYGKQENGKFMLLEAAMLKIAEFK